MPAQFMVENAYTMAPMASPQAPQYTPAGHFIFGSFTPQSPSSMASSFKSYQDEYPPPRAMIPNTVGAHVGCQRESFETDPVGQDQGSLIKYEPQSTSLKTSTPTPPPSTLRKIVRNAAEDKSNEIAFHTDVDTLMKAIQLKSESGSESDCGETAYPSPPPMDEEKFNLRRKSSGSERASSAGGPARRETKKTYICDIKGCGKRCSQKTQLETHKRAHTGEKPYVCKEPGCGLGFSQRGNLKTHTRGHTGEKPYKCDICGKAFAQLGNVKPHRMTHSPRKPFQCIFNGCGKYFGQRGNLKTHHNNFHKDAIKDLTTRFNNLAPGEHLSENEQKLFAHFAELYKNLNKGIKGRGRNRRVALRQKSPLSPSVQSQYPVQQPLVQQHQMYQTRLPLQHGLTSSESFGDYSMSRHSAHGSFMVGRDQHSAYGSYDVDESSVASSDTASVSNSPSTVYEDEYGRAFVPHHRLY